MAAVVAAGETVLAALEGETPRLMDEESFRAFYDRTSAGLWAYLSRMTGDRQLADDLVQEAYYRFYRAGASHVDDTHRRNSLYVIATNVVRDGARRGSRMVTVPLPEPDAANELRGDERTAARAEGRTDLARAMSRLAPRQREMLWLAYAQGASHEEIAETLGVKTGSIKAMLFRARQTVARLLKGNPT
ncbi:MAG TPA: RNA polymerase sigma factor [Thermoanaerobaculia bacterium]|nr:RNA polymerase sigma factor [Thermoanaerobaculia bacterium]